MARIKQRTKLTAAKKKQLEFHRLSESQKVKERETNGSCPKTRETSSSVPDL